MGLFFRTSSLRRMIRTQRGVAVFVTEEKPANPCGWRVKLVYAVINVVTAFRTPEVITLVIVE